MRLDIRSTNVYKYIVVRMSTGEIVLYADDYSKSKEHSILFENYKKETGDDNLRSLGGGKINISPKRKVIAVFGSSGTYGLNQDQVATVAALQEAYPDYQVIMREI